MIRRLDKFRKCLICNKDFIASTSNIDKGKGKFCSKKCCDLWRIGKKTGSDNPHWKGGKTVQAAGYVLIRLPEHPKAKSGNGYVYAHRIVIESYLNRKLETNEIVHHIDGDKTNNRIENLQVMTQNDHVNLHRSKGDL